MILARFFLPLYPKTDLRKLIFMGVLALGVAGWSGLALAQTARLNAEVGINVVSMANVVQIREVRGPGSASPRVDVELEATEAHLVYTEAVDEAGVQEGVNVTLMY